MKLIFIMVIFFCVHTGYIGYNAEHLKSAKKRRAESEKQNIKLVWPNACSAIVVRESVFNCING